MKIEKKVVAKEITVKISGNIDERSDFSGVSSLEGAEKLVVDLGGVESINSCGIREWVRWVGTFPSNLKVSFLRCPRVIIDQVNMIRGFVPKEAEFESFYVPFFCEGCGNFEEVLFVKGQDFSGGQIRTPSTKLCNKCGHVAEWDVIQNVYFKFLA